MKYVDYEEIDKGHKVLDVCEFDKPIYYEYGEGYYNLYDDEEFEEIIKKHSKNIIDLIEVGDYVNGIPVEDITRFKDGTWCITFDEWRWIDNNVNAIETIVTKEQFANMEYRLEV